MDTHGRAQLDWQKPARVPRRLLQSGRASSPALPPRAGSTTWRFWLDAARKPDDVRVFLDRLGAANVGTGGLMRALLALGRGQMRRGGSFASLIAADSLPVAKKLLAEAARAAVTPGSEDRLAAIRLLGLGDLAAARRVLPGLLDARQPTGVQLASLQAMAGFLDRSTCGEILARWKAMSPSVRREAIEVLCSRTVGIDALLNAIESHSLRCIRD